jgi:hypothetical protein
VNQLFNNVEYYYSTDGSVFYPTNISFSSVQSYSYVINGLTNNTTYTVSIMAHNIIGNSNAVSSSPIMVYTIPESPILYSAVPKSQAIDISFSEPSSNGNDIKRYEYSINSQLTYTNMGLPLNNKYTITNLENEFLANGDNSPRRSKRTKKPVVRFDL